MIRFAAMLTLLVSACAQMPWEDGPAGASVSNALKDAPQLGPADGVFPSMMRMQGDLIDGDGQSIGAVNLLNGPHGILLEVTVEAGGLTPGWHGLHLHQVGDCSDIDEFKLSGGHVGKVEGGHGLLNPVGPEGGDLPNIWAAGDGSAALEAFSSLVPMSALANEDGVALIIHESRDDHLSQPIGGAGGRVACSVVR